MTNTKPADIQSPETYIASTQPHAKLADWLKGRQPDKAIAAMMVSAGSKKPGKVIKRVSKPLGTTFKTPKVVKWDKTEKFVYAYTLTNAETSDVFAAGGDDTLALFQTDLYLRTRDDHTEINAITVCAITEPALAAVAEQAEEDDLAGLARKVLTAARIFSTGLEAASIVPDKMQRFRIPFGSGFVLAENRPVPRTEGGEEKTGQVVVVTELGDFAALDEETKVHLDSMAKAMTKDGHPGAEAFGALVKASIAA